MYIYILILVLAGAVGTRLFGVISPQWMTMIEMFTLSSEYWGIVILCALVAVFGACMLGRVVEPWGTTFDLLTRQPIDLALVVLETSTGDHVAQMVTDLRGRFAFWVNPGVYRLRVERSHFEFPPRHGWVGFDVAYGFHYNATNIEITKPGVLGIPIPLEQTAYDWNHEKKLTIASGSLNIPLFRRRLAVSHLLWGAFLIAFAVCIIAPSWVLGVVCGLLGVLLCYRYQWKHSVRPGRVIGAVPTGTQLRLVAIYPKSNVRIADTTVDAMGRYFVLVPVGTYTIQILSGANATVIHEQKDIDGSLGYIHEVVTVSNPASLTQATVDSVS